MLKLVILAVVVLGVVSVYKLWKAHKTITAKSVADEAKDVASAAVDAVKSEINKK